MNCFIHRVIFSSCLIIFSFFAFAGQNDKNTIISKAAKNRKIKNNKRFKSQRNLELLLKETNSPEPFKVEVLAKGLGVPWGLVFLNKEELL